MYSALRRRPTAALGQAHVTLPLARLTNTQHPTCKRRHLTRSCEQRHVADLRQQDSGGRRADAGDAGQEFTLDPKRRAAINVVFEKLLDLFDLLVKDDEDSFQGSTHGGRLGNIEAVLLHLAYFLQGLQVADEGLELGCFRGWGIQASGWCIWQTLIIARHPTELGGPPEEALYYPAARKQHEALLGLRQFDHLQSDACSWAASAASEPV